ncbi:MAG: tetratricopeptide repeat protein [Bacteroidota bacterium]
MRIAAVLLLVLGTVHVSAQADGGTLSREAVDALGIDTPAGAEAYAAALDDAYAFRLAAAEEGFRQLADLEPGSVGGAYGMAGVALWRAFAIEEEDVFDRFYAINDSLQAAADAQGYVLVGAVAKLQRALAFGRQERYTRAAGSFREACIRFRQLTGPDAAYGQGICQAAAGSVPRSYRWIARLLGFRGSIASGLALLDASSSSGGLLAEDATIALAITDATLNERRAGSVDRLVALADARPDSPLLAYLAGYHLLLDRRADEAEAALRRAKAALTTSDADIPFVDAHLGVALYRQHRFDEAIPLLESYVRTFRGRALVAQSTLYAGIAREMTGDRRRAESHYRRVRASRDYDVDLSAAREAERRLESPMTPAERLLVLGGTAYDGGRYDEAVAHLQPVVTDRDLPAVVRAEAAYRTGRARQAQETWDDALRHFRLAVDRRGDPMAKWGPWALYHMGEVEEARGAHGAAERIYQEVLDNEAEFDFHKSLEQRARAAMERIRRS